MPTRASAAGEGARPTFHRSRRCSNGLLVVQRFHWIDARRAARRNVVRDERHRKKQRGDSSHYGGIERRYAVEQRAQGRCQRGGAGHSGRETHQRGLEAAADYQRL